MHPLPPPPAPPNNNRQQPVQAPPSPLPSWRPVLLLLPPPRRHQWRCRAFQRQPHKSGTPRLPPPHPLAVGCRWRWWGGVMKGGCHGPRQKRCQSGRSGPPSTLQMPSPGGTPRAPAPGRQQCRGGSGPGGSPRPAQASPLCAAPQPGPRDCPSPKRGGATEKGGCESRWPLRAPRL